MSQTMEKVGSQAKSQRSRKHLADTAIAAARYYEGMSLLRQRRYADAEPLLREAVTLNPTEPDILFHLGLALRELGKAQESITYYSRAADIKPNDYRIQNEIGLAYWQQNRPDLAIPCYEKAVENHPDSFDARMNYGVSLCDMGRFDEAIHNLQIAKKLWSESPDVYQNIGMTLVRQGRLEEGIQYYDEALKRRPEFPEAHRNRAYALLSAGRYQEAWHHHEYRLLCRFHPCTKVLRPLWTGEPLNGRRIMVHTEQGLGDTIQFMRFVPEVKRRGGFVMLLGQAPLLRMIARSEGVDIALDGSTVVPDIELQVPLMSLPHIFNTSLETLPNKVPYLWPEPAAIDHWNSMIVQAIENERNQYSEADSEVVAELGGRPFLIGVSWQGNPFHSTDRWRSFPAAQLAAIGDLPGIRLVNLQREKGLEQLETWPGRKPMLQLSEHGRNDFNATAAIVSQLDMVICPDTALAHLTGALGIPIWMPISTLGDWRWLDKSETSPWYPTMRIFHQKTLGDWNELFERMTAAVWDYLTGD